MIRPSWGISVTELLPISSIAAPLLAAIVFSLVRSIRMLRPVNFIAALVVAAGPIALAATVLTDPSKPITGSWYLLDPASALFLTVIAAIGLLSALASPSYIAVEKAGFFRKHRAAGTYYAFLYVFWAALIAVPLVDNLAMAWLIVEATTAASAILVAFNGSRGALEAGWKYLVLTTLGLAVALLGIVVLFALVSNGEGSFETLDWSTLHSFADGLDHDQALFALVLILTGLAAKIGWAPVHNWLPDAHSQAPPPVSALLSAALLPTVMLVAWRVQTALEPAIGGSGSGLFLAFGLLSIAVSVPFLWRAQPIKRLLAYSSLEHMGILALGIGFASPLATAGVVIHVAGHALAKSLGFYASIPLLKDDPNLEREPVRALAAKNGTAATALGISLGALGGLPPSPLFVSEALIIAGGIAAGKTGVAVLAGLLVALGFLGLARTTIEGIVGDSESERKPATADWRLRGITILMTVGLLAISLSVVALRHSDLIDRLMGGIA